MAEPKRAIPRIGLAAPVQTCFSCAESEERMALSRMLMTDYIRRLETDLDRALKALRRESHAIDPKEPHRRRV